MKKFFLFENKDAGQAYADALESAGYEQIKKVKQIEHADFILYDNESVGRRREIKAEFIKDRGPAFIYPHTPLTCYIWDGIYEPLPVACNFVAGDGQRAVMRSYDYTYRIEACGFPRCEVRDFIPAKGTNLLFVPARPRRDKGRQDKLDHDALTFIRDNRNTFESVTICRLVEQFPFLNDGDFGWNIITTDPKGTSNPANEMIERIDKADIVIAEHTPAALAVARGKPTIMYSQSDSLEKLNGRPAKHYQKYKHIFDYPLNLLKMNINQVLEFSAHGDNQVERWKQAHIGKNFDANRFLEVIQEYV